MTTQDTKPEDKFDRAIEERLERAIETGNYRLALTNQIELARLKCKEMMTVSLNGGTFLADPVLLTFLHTQLQQKMTRIVLQDVNGNPIEITDLEDFYEVLNDAYHEAHNDYLLEYTRLRKSRSVKAVVGI